MSTSCLRVIDIPTILIRERCRGWWRHHPAAVVMLPESIREYAIEMGLPRDRLVGLDSGQEAERAGFRVRAIPSAHEGLDTDEQGRHLFLGYVIESEGIRLYHSGDSLAYAGLAEQLGPDRFDVLFLADQWPGPGAWGAGEHDRRRGGRPGRPGSGLGSSCLITTTCSRSIPFPSTSLRTRRAGCLPGLCLGSFNAGNGGRSGHEYHVGNRRGNVGHQNDSRSTSVGRSWPRRRPSIRAIILGRVGPSNIPIYGGKRRSRRSSRS